MDDEDDAFLYGDEEGSEPVATAAAERLEDMGEGKDTFSPVFDAKALGRAQDPGVLASSLTGEKGGQAQDRARDAKTEREQDGRQEEDMDEEGSIEDEDSDSDFEIIVDSTGPAQTPYDHRHKSVMPQQQQRLSSMQKSATTFAPEYIPAIRPGQGLATTALTGASLGSDKAAAGEVSTSSAMLHSPVRGGRNLRAGGDGDTPVGEDRTPPQAPATAPRLELNPEEQGLPAEGVDGSVGPSIYHIDPTQLDEKPWRRPGADLTDWFNYGFDEYSWRSYGEKKSDRSQKRSSLSNDNKDEAANLTNASSSDKGEGNFGSISSSMAANQLGAQQLQMMQAMMGASGLSGMSPEMMMKFMGINPSHATSAPMMNIRGDRFGGNSTNGSNDTAYGSSEKGNSKFSSNRNPLGAPAGAGGFMMSMPSMFGPQGHFYGGPFDGSHLQRSSDGMLNDGNPQKMPSPSGQDPSQEQGSKGIAMGNSGGLQRGVASVQLSLQQNSTSNSPVQDLNRVKGENDVEKELQIDDSGEITSRIAHDEKERVREASTQNASEVNAPTQRQDSTGATYEIAQMRSDPHTWAGKGRVNHVSVPGAPTGPSLGVRSTNVSGRGGPSHGLSHASVLSNVPTGPRHPSKKYNDRDTGAGHADSLDYGGIQSGRDSIAELGHEDELVNERRQSRSPSYQSSSRREREREGDRDWERGREKPDFDEREVSRGRRRGDNDTDAHDGNDRHRRRRGGGQFDDDVEEIPSSSSASRSSRRRRGETKSRSASLDHDEDVSNRKRSLVSSTSRREKREHHGSVAEEQGVEEDDEHDEDGLDGERRDGRERTKDRDRVKDRGQRRAERRAGRDSDTGASTTSSRPHRKRGAPDDDVASLRESRRRK